MNVGHEYMFARLHGMWASAQRGEAIQALVRAQDEEQLVHMLKDRGINADHYDTFQEQLQLREIDILNGIRKKLDSRTADFYGAFVHRVYYNNVKTLLHHRYFKEREKNANNLVVDLPEYPIDVDHALSVASTEEFLKCLHAGDEYDIIRDCVLKLEQTGDIIMAECTLDKLAYGNLLASARKLPRSMRGDALELVGDEIDILNIGALLRIVRTYRFTSERVHPMWLDGGNLLEEAQLTALSQYESIKDVIAHLPHEYSNQLSSLVGGELYLIEHKLWTGHYHLALKIFRGTQSFDQVLVAFPFLQHYETRNIGRIFEGIHFGVQPRDMLDMIIG